MKFNFFVYGLFLLSCHQSFASADFAFTDNAGVKWTHTLSQKFTDGCLNAQGGADINACSDSVTHDSDSAALAACHALNLKLPTEAQYINLMKSFDHTVSDFKVVFLTARGTTQMETAFGHDWDSSQEADFISSTLNLSISARFYSPALNINPLTPDESTTRVEARFNSFLVRCVDR